MSSTTIFNTSAEAVADTNKTNPTSALSKCEILIEIGSGGAFCASFSLRQRIGSIVSQIQPKSQQNSVARAPLRLRSGQALAREQRGPSPFPTPSWQETPTASRCSGFSSHPIRTQ